MEVPLPPGFARALNGKGREVILAVLESMKGCTLQDLPLVESYLNDPDPDVAVTAVGLLATRGLGDARCRARLRAVLQEGRRDKTLAALEAMQGGGSYRYESEKQFKGMWDSPGAPSVPAGKTIADELLDAFGAPSQPGPAASPPIAGGAAGDLLTAFGVAEPPDGDRKPSDECTLRHLGDAVVALVDASKDPEVKFQGLLVLISWSNARAVAKMEPMLGKRTVSERRVVAEWMGRIPGGDAVGLAQRLLQDSSEDVRTAPVPSRF